MMQLLKEKGLDDVLVVVGGIIPDVDIPKLRDVGVKGIFLPGTPMQDIIDFITRQRPYPRGAGLRCRTSCCSPTTASPSSGSSS